MKIVGIIIGGLVACVGVYAICSPLATFLTIGWIVGALLLSNGITIALQALKQEKKDVFACILGIICALAGLSLLFNGFSRFLTDMMVIYFIAASVLCSGVVQCIAGYKMYKALHAGIPVIICGVLSILLGIFACGHPLFTVVTVGYIIGFNLLMQGVGTIIAALSIPSEA